MRLKSAVPPAVAGNVLEQTAAKLSHLALYAFSIIMPVTGVAMGIFGGKGIPFFGLGTVPGLDPKQSGKGWIAGKKRGCCACCCWKCSSLRSCGNSMK